MWAAVSTRKVQPIFYPIDILSVGGFVCEDVSMNAIQYIAFRDELEKVAGVRLREGLEMFLRSLKSGARLSVHPRRAFMEPAFNLPLLVAPKKFIKALGEELSTDQASLARLGALGSLLGQGGVYGLGGLGARVAYRRLKKKKKK